MIDTARAAGSLHGTSQDDLFAPHHKHEKNNHAKLCRVLRERYGIELALKDFVLDDPHDDGRPGYLINPLQLTKVEGSNRLLVISCGYVIAKRRKKQNLDFDVAPDSVTVHLFEAMGSAANAPHRARGSSSAAAARLR